MNDSQIPKTSPFGNLTEQRDFCIVQATVLEILFMLMYSLVTIVAVIGNSTVCYIIITDLRMRSVTNLFLLNIAVTDIVKAVVYVPFNYIPNLLYEYWPFGTFMCAFISYIQLVAVFGGAFTMVAMSLDRFVAILHPLRPKLTRTGVGKSIIVVWLIALAFPLPTAIFSEVSVPSVVEEEDCMKGRCMEEMKYSQAYSFVVMLAQYFVPLTVLAYTFTRIGYVIWIKPIPGEAVQIRDERLASSKRKMIKMMIVVVMLYAICWLPCHVLYLVGDAHEKIYFWDDIKYVFNGAFLLAASHSCCNPFVYIWMNRRFKAGFKSVFISCLCCVKNGFNSRNSLMGRTSFSMSARKENTNTPKLRRSLSNSK